MNHIKAKVKAVSATKQLHIVEFAFADEPLYMMGLELDERLGKESEVILGIKPTHVLLSCSFNIDVSCLNQLRVSVVSIEVGELLCSVKGAVNGVIIEAVTTAKAYYRMNFGVGDSIVMFLPSSELYIREIISY